MELQGQRVLVNNAAVFPFAPTLGRTSTRST
jgi:hypothetical protein